jgi:methylated-DNA-[protein]-cysteine S-methyltransferase
MMRQKSLYKIEPLYDTFESPLGTLYLIFAGEILKGISFKRPRGPLRKGKAPSWITKELKEYFERGLEKFSQKTGFLKGTEFEKRVWLSLKEIPYGETRPYKWLAEKVGNPNATRAVGQALSRNPLPIILPCHRIIESDGSIGGYSSGADIKRRLLEIEYYISLSKK